MNYRTFLLLGLGIIVVFGFYLLFLRKKQILLDNEKTQLLKLKEELQKNYLKASNACSSYEAQVQRIPELEDRISTLINENTQLEKSNATLISEKESIEGKIKEQQEHLDKVKKSLTDEFHNLSHKIFEDRSKRFVEDSKKNIETILNPFKKDLEVFKKQVSEAYNQESRERFALQKEIQLISDQACNLTKAFKGEVKCQGNWGEMVLQRILESSGLREGTEFILQGKGLDLVDAEGKRQLPDVTIKLPENKHIIIDSKVSFIHYERYVKEDDKDEKKLIGKEFLGSIYSHIKSLSAKHYHNNSKLNAPEIVLMFLPMEALFATAVQLDEELFHFAWSKSVILVSPGNVYAMLKTIDSLWRMEKRNLNADKIAREGGALYDKFVDFVQDMEKIGKNLNLAEQAYQSAFNKLATGRGNLMKKAENLKGLGLKTRKCLPENYIDKISSELLTKESTILP